MYCPPFFLLVLSIGLVCGPSGASVAAQDESPKPPLAEQWPSEIAQPLADTASDPQRVDRAEALALYAHGRWLMKQDDFAGALSRLQRAWRRDPQSAEPLAAIVPLAINLKRYDEAARYALIAAPRNLVDREPLLALAPRLSQRQQWAEALELYRHAAPSPGEVSDARGVLLYRELGRLYYLTDQSAKAAEAMEVVRAALSDPAKFRLSPSHQRLILDDPDQTYTLMAEIFLDAGDANRAEEMFRQANQTLQDESWLAYQLARVDAARKRPDVALTHLDQYLNTQPDDAGREPYELLQQLYLNLEGDQQRGQARLLERLQQLHTADPDNADLGYFLADSWRKEGNTDQAQALYTRLLAQRADVEHATFAVQLAAKRQDQDALLNALRQSVEGGLTLVELGGVLKPILQQPAASTLLEACQDRLGSAELDVREASLLATVAANLAISLERFEVVDSLTQRAVAGINDHVAAVGLLEEFAQQLLSADRFLQSADVFRQAIQRAEGLEEVCVYYYYLAGALELAGQTDEALEAARKASELSPDSALMQSRTAWVLYHARRYPEAIDEYRKLLSQFDEHHTNPGIREVLRDARLVLSNIAVRQGDLATGEQWLEQVLDEFPRDIGALNDLGYLWIDQNQHLHRALPMVRTAVEQEPDNNAYRDSLGWGFFRLGQIEEAIAELERAAQQDDPDPTILDHLGDAYFANGQRSEALELWRRALQEFHSQEDAEHEARIKKKIEDHTP